ncbi:3-deoxy-D-manno-octulosonate 8-phosphate phosphatase [Campylobacter fetus]|uniref:3-deoxy-D-manno-octulosonate 8-phosphate phosphatase n=2 Tax=Campylobacter fetus TaxID=196 RepID=A0AAX0HDL8_CAMFE|nr:HAD hydrolase family protein [Campylobacter fetus]MPB72493.1 3-deoxy-D-manno-octulosonate 8-phosphate phosphatase [Campylobacter fetus]MPB77195.1 3-deoxy-D-manno-octulosonate 8-phosphate phosphatase [Campylobacter fetus]OCR91667.1 3-deoxy-D-manno-octulosonate 8-phosphate phosphatase [Campylobacter fetus subsp. testudinum]OCR94382.1 3-deoxy-D-manno-octulosonate 8-phosphate phosphatase [Campylobacter fetus subsp. testudinum]OCR97887.1 3-deoxy-D-manno-octulosonate 8-phosphate phosphatase [Camp
MIEIIFLDVDGCLSDGGIYKTNTGDEFKRFDVKDGFAIEQWNKLGKISAIITGKKSLIVENRAKELGIKYCFQGVKDKFAQADEILKLEGFSWENTAAIGDDLNDMKLLSKVAISFKPIDAHNSIKADIELSKKGGYGAVREMIDILIDRLNLKDEWMKRWL